MSVFIPGMKMPDGCHHCRFSYLDKGETNDGQPCTVIMCSAMDQGTNGAEYDGNRPSWCPLVPLPEGHGRLGDLDELFEKMYHLSDNEGTNKDSRADDALILRDSACYLIEDATTIIPAEGDQT